MANYFPLDIAADMAFLDRDEERARLKANIMSNTHTLVTSPRRYGKTSLVRKSIAELEVPSASMDMMLASNTARMKTIILDGISRGTSAIISGRAKYLALAKKIFQPFTAVESIEFGQVALRFQASVTKADDLIVYDALQRLELLANNLNKRVVLFFDEYQHVLSIKGALEFEAALRSFAQTATSVVFVFSGSNRHLLEAMFSDQARPFYNMCDHMVLRRIAAEDYTRHLTLLSREQWGKALASDAIACLLDVTACHAYYVNALCRRVWRYKTLPGIDSIMDVWRELCQEQRYAVSHDFEKLSPIQRTVLLELAVAPFSHPTSIEVMLRLQASTSGIMNAVEGLVEKDYICRDKEGRYSILNPLMEAVLRRASVT